jgi:ketosteroid isomerase-like protein
MPSATPAEVLARRSQLILSGDADGFADLFAPDAVIESSFAGPPGTPARLQGREAIRQYSRRVMASPLRLEDVEVAELYQTQDPEVVITEMRGEGDRDHDRPAVHDDVRSDHPDPGRSYSALPRRRTVGRWRRHCSSRGSGRRKSVYAAEITAICTLCRYISGSLS